jgi:hypothetical protein
MIEHMLTASKGALHLKMLAVCAHIADRSGVACATNSDTFSTWDGIGNYLLEVLAHYDVLYKRFVRS